MLPLEQLLQVPYGYLDLPLWRRAHCSIVFVLHDIQAILTLLLLLLLLPQQWLAARSVTSFDGSEQPCLPCRSCLGYQITLTGSISCH